MATRRKDVGACGHHCAACLDFRARATDDETLRRRAAAAIENELGLEIDLHKVGCDGCWGDSHNPWGASVDCRIRQCVESKSFTTCAECDEFCCDTFLAQFDEDGECAENIRAIRRLGIKKWLAGNRANADA